MLLFCFLKCIKKRKCLSVSDDYLDVHSRLDADVGDGADNIGRCVEV